MTAATSTSLTAWLLARLDEDEAVARAALAAEDGFVASYHGDTAAEYALGLAESEGADRRVTEHYARHDPARVLAEVEAKREVIRLAWWDDECFSDQSRVALESLGHAPPVLYALAQPYRSHPGFNESWSL